jgi:uncharacterized protein (TIGR02611 family)
MRLRVLIVTLRNQIRSRRSSNVVYRSVVGALGGILVLGGLLLVPLPGPGWLIVLLGLAVLASEFSWAARLQHGLRRRLTAWRVWMSTKPRPLRWLIGTTTVLTVIGILIVLYLLLGKIDDSGGFWGDLLDRLKN